MAVNYNDGKWHGWNGGECPVHSETVVEVRSWAGCSRTVAAKSIASWNDDLAQSQPVAFRVIKEHREPREFWVDPERCIATEFYHSGFIHVREVIE